MREARGEPRSGLARLGAGDRLDAFGVVGHGFRTALGLLAGLLALDRELPDGVDVEPADAVRLDDGRPKDPLFLETACPTCPTPPRGSRLTTPPFPPLRPGRPMAALDHPEVVGQQRDAPPRRALRRLLRRPVASGEGAMRRRVLERSRGRVQLLLHGHARWRRAPGRTLVQGLRDLRGVVGREEALLQAAEAQEAVAVIEAVPHGAMGGRSGTELLFLSVLFVEPL